MGSFSAERSALLNSLSCYTDVLRRRKDALLAVQSVSGELLEKLVAGDVDGLNEVLNRRAKACSYLTKTMQGAPELASVIDQARGIATEETAASIVGLDEELKAILADVVDKQQKCEEMLKSEIEKTAELLRQSTKRRQLNTAYGPANARPQARFLDSKH